MQRRRSSKTLTPERAMFFSERLFWVVALAVYSVGHDVTRDEIRRWRKRVGWWQSRCDRCGKLYTSVCLDCHYRHGGRLPDVKEPFEPSDLVDWFNPQNYRARLRAGYKNYE